MPSKHFKEGTIGIYQLPNPRSSCAVVSQQSLIITHHHSTTQLHFATSATCLSKPNSLKILFHLMQFKIQSLSFIFFAYPSQLCLDLNHVLLIFIFCKLQHGAIIQIFLLRHFLSRGNALNQAYFRLYFPPDKSKMEHDFNNFEERE